MKPFDAYGSLAVSIDGQLVSGAAAAVSVWDHGLLYGDGCFEGMRLRRGLLFRPSEHLDRLHGSARALAIELPASDDEILARIAEVAAENELEDAHVRVLLTRGVGAPGLDPRRSERPSLIVFAYPLPPLLGDRPVRLIVSSIVRKTPRSMDARVKSLNYLDGILAKQQANAAGADDALMLDDAGVLAEATSTNVFVVRDSAVATPTTRAALPGVTRRTVIEILREAEIEVIERDVTWGEVYAADECLLTGSGAGIVAVAAVDGRELPGPPGPLTRLIRERYARAVVDPLLTVDLRSVGGRK
jgi:branched-chain amino acid aminotransferase